MGKITRADPDSFPVNVPGFRSERDLLVQEFYLLNPHKVPQLPGNKNKKKPWTGEKGKTWKK